MERCHRCRFGLPSHGPGCPETPGLDPHVRTLRENAYSLGYADGRSGRPSSGTDVSYQLGYNNGEVALEEAENSERW